MNNILTNVYEIMDSCEKDFSDLESKLLSLIHNLDLSHDEKLIVTDLVIHRLTGILNYRIQVDLTMND